LPAKLPFRASSRFPGEAAKSLSTAAFSSIHPDGHEISYVFEGAIKVQIDKQPDRVFKAGEGFHINANVAHRGVGEASGGKLLAVRIKPKDKPIMQPVQHTN
jgi:mannose-6-phosphate isomerase-like protein (cupin superfamily)